jgi:hypothetical protein
MAASITGGHLTIETQASLQIVIPTDQREWRNLQLPFLLFLPDLIASAQSPYQATFSGKNSANNSS